MACFLKLRFEVLCRRHANDPAAAAGSQIDIELHRYRLGRRRPDQLLLDRLKPFSKLEKFEHRLSELGCTGRVSSSATTNTTFFSFPPHKHLEPPSIAQHLTLAFF